MARRQPLEVMREWTDADGEEWVAGHPVYLALGRHYCPDAKGLSRFEIIRERLKEIRSGERRLPGSVAEEILELDSEQRQNGYPDDGNVGRWLIELLRDAAGA
jgi:hypothetical protein